MAVHNQIPGLVVTVHSEGQALKELPDTRQHPQNPNSLETHCYIEATDGASWKVVFEFDEDWEDDGYSLRIRTDVDGKYMDSVIANVKHIKPGFMRISDANRSGGQRRIPHFNLLDIVEHSLADIKKKNHEIGTIKVSIWRVISRKANRGGGGGNAAEGLTGSVSENAVKKGGAVSHGTDFVASGTGKSLTSPDLEYIDDRKKPMVIYYFYYRSLKSLKDLRVVARTPSPERESEAEPEQEFEAEPDLESMPSNKLQDYVKLLRQIEQARKQVKDEDLDMEPRRPNFWKRRAAGEDDDDDLEFLKVKPLKRTKTETGGSADHPLVIDEDERDDHDTIFLD